MARLLFKGGGQRLQPIELKPGVNRIGRSSANHFQIIDPSVSSVHCEVIVIESMVSIRDLQSTNGTFVDGHPVNEAALRSGQVVHLGAVELVLEQVEQTELPQVAIPPLVSDPPPAPLLFPDGSAACLNHPEAHALFQCTLCQQSFCETCIRVVQRVGGKPMAFCPSCPGQCERIVLTTAKTKAKSFFGRLTETLKLSLRR